MKCLYIDIYVYTNVYIFFYISNHVNDARIHMKYEKSHVSRIPCLKTNLLRIASASRVAFRSLGVVWFRLVNRRLASSESHSAMSFALAVFGLPRANKQEKVNR